MTQIPNLICGVELEVGQNDTSSQYKHKCFYMEEMKKCPAVPRFLYLYLRFFFWKEENVIRLTRLSLP